MKRSPTAIALLQVTLDPAAHTPVHRQLYEGVRQAILSGRLPTGTQLPATRALAATLGISRNTVLNAFDQLLAEGYLEARQGAGTYVSSALPEELLLVRAPEAPPPDTAQRAPSRRGRLLADTPVNAGAGSLPAGDFRPGLPALDAFPLTIWARLTARRWRNPPPELLGYGDPAGYPPLRAAIAAYLAAARGVRCEPSQVIVVAGSQQGLDLTARALLDPGDGVWVEEPGYIGAKGALIAAGAQLIPVPVDDEGLAVAAGIERAPDARLVCVTPSHQYPLGVTMSLARRLALLEWAQRAGAWVVEDDYDSEYRYAGRPLPALQGLDRQSRTIYVGTFSKVLFPALRLGYLVVPHDLVPAFRAARALSDRHSPAVDQAVLADFMAEGHFARHIRRTRALYQQRQQALLAAAAQHLPGLLEVAPAEAGMHLVGWLPPGTNDRHAAQRAAAHGIDAPALSSYALAPLDRAGLLLGYTAMDERRIHAGVRRLAAALREEGKRG